VNHDVRPDSILLLNAAKEVVEEEGFDDMLDEVRARVDEIEGKFKLLLTLIPLLADNQL
jgi:hypothetical protein